MAAKQKKKVAMAAASILVIAVSFVFIFRAFGSSNSIAEESRHRDVICSETGEVFLDFNIPIDSRFPYKNPKTGQNTLYPAECCYWNADGTAKTRPTLVLCNELIGKPGPTRCPDCGRVVVPHNPAPPMELMIEAARREKGGD